MSSPFNRLKRPAAITVTLLLLAACSTSSLPRAPQDVEAIVGPEYAQIYWSYPLADIDFEVQARTAGSDWARPDGLIMEDGAGSALVPLTAGVATEFRVGAVIDGQTIWQNAPHVLTASDGLTLQVGTLNRGEWSDSAGTVFLIYLDLPDGTAVPLDLELHGPAGWAAGAHPVQVGPEHLAQGWIFGFLYGLDALPGTYSLNSVDGTWQTQMVFSRADYRLDPATDLQVTDLDAAAGSLSASWSPPVTGALTQLAVSGEGYGNYRTTFLDSVILTELSLDPAGARFEVTASNARLLEETGIMPHPLGASHADLDLAEAD